MPVEKNSKPFTFSGYTLIELLVVVFIIASLFLVGVAGFRDYSRKQYLKKAATQLKGDLRLAQEQALAGKKPAGCSVLDGYNFFFNTATNRYSIAARCAGVGVSPRNFGLPTGVTLSLSASFPNPIIFKAIGDGNNIPPASDAVVTLNYANLIQTVTITSGGQIK